MELIYYPNKILSEKCNPVLTFDSQLKVLADQMIDILYEKNAVGLAANQIGVPLSIIVVDPSGGALENQLKILVNPKIINQSKEMVLSSEGCLSFPGIEVNVERPDETWIEYQDLNGNLQKNICRGDNNKIILHEIDHLNGLTFLDRMKPLAKKLAIKDYNKFSALKKLIPNYY